jgi:hypothetical protein
MHQIEQRHRVRAARDGDDRSTRLGEQPRPGEVGSDAIQEKSHTI